MCPMANKTSTSGSHFASATLYTDVQNTHTPRCNWQLIVFAVYLPTTTTTIKHWFWATFFSIAFVPKKVFQFNLWLLLVLLLLQPTPKPVKCCQEKKFAQKQPWANTHALSSVYMRVGLDSDNGYSHTNKCIKIL